MSKKEWVIALASEVLGIKLTDASATTIVKKLAGIDDKGTVTAELTKILKN